MVDAQLRASAAAAAQSEDAAQDLATGAEEEEDPGYLASRQLAKQKPPQEEARAVISGKALADLWEVSVAANAEAPRRRNTDLAGDGGIITPDDAMSVVRFRELFRKSLSLETKWRRPVHPNGYICLTVTPASGR